MNQKESTDFVSTLGSISTALDALTTKMLQAADAMDEFGRTIRASIDQQLAALPEDKRAEVLRLVAGGAYWCDAFEAVAGAEAHDERDARVALIEKLSDCMDPDGAAEMVAAYDAHLVTVIAALPFAQSDVGDKAWADGVMDGRQEAIDAIRQRVESGA